MRLLTAALRLCSGQEGTWLKDVLFVCSFKVFGDVTLKDKEIFCTGEGVGLLEDLHSSVQLLSQPCSNI